MSKMTVEKFVTKLLNQLESGKIQLPTLPEVALRVRDAVDDPDVSAGQIAEVLSEDTAFSARLLQVANSALSSASVWRTRPNRPFAARYYKPRRCSLARRGYGPGHEADVSSY